VIFLIQKVGFMQVHHGVIKGVDHGTKLEQSVPTCYKCIFKILKLSIFLYNTLCNTDFEEIYFELHHTF